MKRNYEYSLRIDFDILRIGRDVKNDRIYVDFHLVSGYNSYGCLSNINRGERVAVSYRKLWHLLLDKKIGKIELVKSAGLSDYTLRKLNKDEDVSTEVLSKISAALDCDVQDIVDFLPEPKNGVQNKS